MKFYFGVLPFAAAFIISSALPLKRDVNRSLVPEFGLSSGINPTGTGDCDGITNAAGQVVKIPCSCPPDRNAFIRSLDANVNAGRVVNNPSIPVSFPTDNSTASQLARLQTAIVTLQNFKGAGVGCPAASTTFLAQQKAIQSGSLPALAATSPKPSPSTAATTGSAVVAALVPQFGVTAGVNPTGTGDCDGVTNAAGQVVKIPCSCPPNRDAFIKDLSANVAAGKVILNPSIPISFPEDNSTASQLTRLQAAIVTLQNINGPGKGCPAASTTFLAQQKAIQDSA